MSWSKEDRKIFNISEVFRNMENKIIDDYRKLELAQKIATYENVRKEINDTNNAANKLKETVSDINEIVGGNSASDHEVVSGENIKVTVSENNSSDASEEEEYFQAQIKALSSMAYEAGLSGNIKLAYKIERAIEEIKEAINEDK